MRKTIGNLLLALLNATLILVAVCLFFVWKISQTTDNITETLTGSLITIQPLGDKVSDLTGELQGLRTDLQDYRAERAADPNRSLEALNTRITQIDTRLSQISNQIADLRAVPEELMESAVQGGVDRALKHVALLRGCRPLEDPLS